MSRKRKEASIITLSESTTPTITTTSAISSAVDKGSTTLESLPPWNAQYVLRKRLLKNDTIAASESVIAMEADGEGSDAPIQQGCSHVAVKNRDVTTETAISRTDSSVNWAISPNNWWIVVSPLNPHVNNNVNDDYHSDSSSTTGERQRNSSQRHSSSLWMSSSSLSPRKTFRNVGLSLWNETRLAWRNYRQENDCENNNEDGGIMEDWNDTTNVDSKTTEKDISSTSSKQFHSNHAQNSKHLSKKKRFQSQLLQQQQSQALTSSQYRELIRGLTQVTREYTLPTCMNLAYLIEVYVDIWDNCHEPE